MVFLGLVCAATEMGVQVGSSIQCSRLEVKVVRRLGFYFVILGVLGFLVRRQLGFGVIKVSGGVGLGVSVEGFL